MVVLHGCAKEFFFPFIIIQKQARKINKQYVAKLSWVCPEPGPLPAVNSGSHVARSSASFNESLHPHLCTSSGFLHELLIQCPTIENLHVASRSIRCQMGWTVFMGPREAPLPGCASVLDFQPGGEDGRVRA